MPHILTSFWLLNIVRYLRQPPTREVCSIYQVETLTIQEVARRASLTQWAPRWSAPASPSWARTVTIIRSQFTLTSMMGPLLCKKEIPSKLSRSMDNRCTMRQRENCISHRWDKRFSRSRRHNSNFLLTLGTFALQFRGELSLQRWRTSSKSSMRWKHSKCSLAREIAYSRMVGDMAFSV